MASWLEQNKIWLGFFLVVLIPTIGGIGGYYTLRADVKKNTQDICDLDKRETQETKRSVSVDNARTGQVARIETKLEYIERDVSEIKEGQKEILDLLRRQNNNFEGDKY